MLPYIGSGMTKIPTFPIVIVIAFFCCGLFYIRKIYSDEDIDRIMKIVVTSVVGSAVGGKLLSAIILTIINEKNFFFNLFSPGCVFYGCLVGGIVCLYGACKFYKHSFGTVVNKAALILPLGQAIGRIGCFLNGCCYGKEYHGIGSIAYEVLGKNTRVVPAWFIESAVCICIFIFLNHLYKSKKYMNIYAPLYLILYGSARFFVEYLRGDSVRGQFGMFSTSQIISIIIVIIGAMYIKIHKEGEEL